MNSVISICEYQRVPISDAKDNNNRRLNPAQATELRRLQPHLPAKAFSWGHKCIRWGSYCGLVPLAGVTLEISPKLHSSKTDVAHGREVLIKMLAETGELKLHKSAGAHIGYRGHSLLDIFILDFCQTLAEQLRQGAAKEYQQNIENLPVLRGKLLIASQLKHNTGTPNKLYCQFDELTHDTPLNQLIRTTLIALRAVCHSALAKQRLEVLSSHLDGVTTLAPKNAIKLQIQFDRTNERFKSIAQQCQQFLTGLYPDIVSGNSLGTGLLFDMNTLFERWLGVVFRRISFKTGMYFQSQGPIKHLATEVFVTGQQKSRFRLKPDFTLAECHQTRLQPVIIADAKWKLLDDREVSSKIIASDLYQMQSYAACYCSGTVALLYPTHENFCSVKYLRLNDLPETKLLLIPISLNSSVSDLANDLIEVLSVMSSSNFAEIPVQLTE